MNHRLDPRRGSRYLPLRTCACVLVVWGTLSCQGARAPHRRTPAPQPDPAEVWTASALRQRLLQAGEAIRKGQPQRVPGLLRPVLLNDPDHLEAWVLRAMAAAARRDEAGAAEAWDRVQGILTYRGKLHNFALRTTLLAAARRYLAAGQQSRAQIFLEEVWRRFPGSEPSAVAHLLVAEAAYRDARWSAVIARCDQLARIVPSGPQARRCTELARLARRLRAVGPRPAPGAPRWVWESPLPQGNDLHDLWVFRDGGALAVGAAGTILRAEPDGRRFRPVATGTRWTLRAIGGVAEDALYAVGDGGIILRFDGKRWAVVRQAAPEQADLWAAHAVGPEYLLAVGASGRAVEVRHGRVTTKTVASVTLRDVGGSGPDRMFAVGDQGVLLRGAGGSWQVVKSDTYEDLWGVFVLGPEHLVAVGSRRTAVTYDGQKARERVVGLADFRDVWAADAGSVWAVGSGGSVIRRQAGQWVEERTETTMNLNAVAGNGRAIWAAGDGGTLLRRRGQRWQRVAGGFRQRLVDVEVVAGEAVALGDGGALQRRRGRGRWISRDLPAGRYHASWGDGQHWAAVGDRGKLVVRRGERFQVVETRTSEDLFGVEGGPGGLLVVGARGTVLRVEQGRVRRETVPTGRNLRAISWRRDGEALAVGDRGVVLRLTAGGWTEEDSGTLSDLLAVWSGPGEEVAVGRDGTILARRRDGRWRLEQGPVSQDLVGLWAGGAADVYAVSRGGAIIHFDGKRWSVQDSPASCLSAIDGDGQKLLLAVGCDGTIMRYQGSVDGG